MPGAVLRRSRASLRSARATELRFHQRIVDVARAEARRPMPGVCVALFPVRFHQRIVDVARAEARRPMPGACVALFPGPRCAQPGLRRSYPDAASADWPICNADAAGILGGWSSTAEI